MTSLEHPNAASVTAIEEWIRQKESVLTESTAELYAIFTRLNPLAEDARPTLWKALKRNFAARSITLWNDCCSACALEPLNALRTLVALYIEKNPTLLTFPLLAFMLLPKARQGAFQELRAPLLELLRDQPLLEYFVTHGRGSRFPMWIPDVPTQTAALWLAAGTLKHGARSPVALIDFIAKHSATHSSDFFDSLTQTLHTCASVSLNFSGVDLADAAPSIRYIAHTLDKKVRPAWRTFCDDLLSLSLSHGAIITAQYDNQAPFSSDQKSGLMETLQLLARDGELEELLTALSDKNVALMGELKAYEALVKNLPKNLHWDSLPNCIARASLQSAFTKSCLGGMHHAKDDKPKHWPGHLNDTALSALSEVASSHASPETTQKAFREGWFGSTVLELSQNVKEVMLGKTASDPTLNVLERFFFEPKAGLESAQSAEIFALLATQPEFKWVQTTKSFKSLISSPEWQKLMPSVLGSEAWKKVGAMALVRDFPRSLLDAFRLASTPLALDSLWTLYLQHETSVMEYVRSPFTSYPYKVFDLLNAALSACLRVGISKTAENRGLRKLLSHYHNYAILRTVLELESEKPTDPLKAAEWASVLWSNMPPSVARTKNATAAAGAILLKTLARVAPPLRALKTAGAADWHQLDVALRNTSNLRAADAAWLELAFALGKSSLTALLAVAKMRNTTAAQGHHFDRYYKCWHIPKKHGGKRIIMEPKLPLKLVQRAILDNVLMPLGVHPAAQGFVPNRSIVTNAAPHVGRRVVVNTDIHQCFPSTQWNVVKAALLRDLSGKFREDTIDLIVDITTQGGALPTGAPTSPMILNRVLYPADCILAKLAEQRGTAYTRYADDLTFSGEDDAVKLLAPTGAVLKRIGLVLDPRKTNIFRRGRRQCCTGLVVNEQVSVPRIIRRKIRAAVHEFARTGCATWNGKPQSAEALLGRIHFLHMVHPEEADALLNKMKKDKTVAAEMSKRKVKQKNTEFQG